VWRWIEWSPADELGKGESEVERGFDGVEGEIDDGFVIRLLEFVNRFDVGIERIESILFSFRV
jgi:hypothetical protein